MRLTNHIGKVCLQEVDEEVAAERERYIIIVRTEGVFLARITCSLDKALGQAILMNMVKGRALAAEEQKLFLMEFLNIICGNGLTMINNQKKSASRLEVPVFTDEEPGNLIEDGMQKESITFQSSYGFMVIAIDYEMKS